MAIYLRLLILTSINKSDSFLYSVCKLFMTSGLRLSYKLLNGVFLVIIFLSLRCRNATNCHFQCYIYDSRLDFATHSNSSLHFLFLGLISILVPDPAGPTAANVSSATGEKGLTATVPQQPIIELNRRDVTWWASEAGDIWGDKHSLSVIVLTVRRDWLDGDYGAVNCKRSGRWAHQIRHICNALFLFLSLKTTTREKKKSDYNNVSKYTVSDVSDIYSSSSVLQTKQ